jgi:hypothetical protein
VAHGSGTGVTSLPSSGRLSATDSPVNTTPITCEDLFHALVSNVSTVVLPTVVPTSSTKLQQHNNSSSDASDDSSSLAETVSESSSIPSHLPTSVTLYSNADDRDDGFALSSICSDDNIGYLNTHFVPNNTNMMGVGTNSNGDFDDDDDDSSDFHSQNDDNYSDSPPHFHLGSPNKSINNLLSDNSEVEIDFNDEDSNVLNASLSPSRISPHHQYQEEQRYLFEQGNIIDSGLEEEGEEEEEEEEEEGRYECDRYLAADDDCGNNRSWLSDNSAASSHSNAASATYDANLRKLLGE